MIKGFSSRFLAPALVITGLAVGMQAQAQQLQINTAGVAATQIPIAIAAFADENLAPQQVSAIIKADLDRSGYFKIIDTGNSMSETSSINYSDWKARGAFDLVVGSVQQLADGRYDVRYRLLDIGKQTQLSGFALTDIADHTRLTAHKIADDIYQKLTGVPGDFSTRLSYVTKSGGEYKLQVADSDGNNVHDALRSNAPIISPSWSPDGTKVAYVSFENRKPVVYVQDLITKERTVVANYKGSNSAPAWSPDSSKLAVALTLSGSTQIYSVNANGGSLQRLSNSGGIDTEPRFSPDGQSIYFTSDRSGGPQIYKMSASGGSAQRITFKGDWNTTPRISPDGKTLAFISRRDGQYQLYAVDLTNSQELRLSDSGDAEAPSFSPNGRYIMYATKSGGRGTLAVVSIDGSVKHQLTTQVGEIREPTWGPFMK
ncbi:MAG TPA: Tol-Pal system beta propeller repeat protein TolB [Burkholderiaceae bacterium]|nr:Tol-Pal system beta propeller repeat protein TolB [Burkholderiaceae bacterium]